jgi:hypothetical protein
MMLVFKVEYYSAERYLSIFYLLVVLNIFLQIDDSFELIRSVYFKWGIYFGLSVFTFYSIFRTIKNVYFWYNLRDESFSADIVEELVFRLS